MKEYTTDQLRELDKKYLWHPFTPMLDWLESEPLIIERGEGAYLYDTDGNRYLDGVSSLWVNTHGHRAKLIDEYIKEQLGKIAHSTLLGLSNVPAILLAEKLIAITPPGLTRVFYSDSGSTAVEIALKMAFQYQRQKKNPEPKRTKFISLVNAYHGDTIGAVSLGGIELFHALYKPLLFHTIKSPSPYCYRCPVALNYPSCEMECLKILERKLVEHAGEVAGIVIEPIVQGAAGMLVAPDGFLKGVRELCDRFDVVMIADEVATGFGRTGKMFACEHENVSPDIMAIAKGITGGYLPIAATLVNDKIFEAFLTRYEEQKTFYHGHTYTGNPLGCASALANIRIFEEERVIEKLGRKIKRLQEGLNKLRDFKHIGDIRAKGLMVGIELVKDRSSKEPFHISEKVGVKVCMRARHYGVILRPLGDVVVLMPPLCATEEDIDFLLNALQNSLTDILVKELGKTF